MKKEAKRTQITEALCKQAQLMRRGGANQTEIGKLLGVNPCTISRIEKAGFDLKTYQENTKTRKEKEQKKTQEPEKPEAEEPIEGQIEMELTVEKPDMSDQTKMMRFQAAQVDKLIMKLDQIYNMTSMILRAIRKE